MVRWESLVLKRELELEPVLLDEMRSQGEAERHWLARNSACRSRTTSAFDQASGDVPSRRQGLRVAFLSTQTAALQAQKIQHPLHKGLLPETAFGTWDFLPDRKQGPHLGIKKTSVPAWAGPSLRSAETNYYQAPKILSLLPY